MYGDELRDFSETARYFLSLTRTQYDQLRRWAEGDFVGDWAGPPVAVPFCDVPLQEQPFQLDAAALGELLGGPFRPAVEVSWTLRVPFSWQDPRARSARTVSHEGVPGGGVKDDFGPVLTPEMALDDKVGRQVANGPGTLARWMGVPWQADAGSCLGAYDPHLFLPTPALWPARIPTEVLGAEAFERLGDVSLPMLQRYKYFGFRSYWLRDVDNTSALDRLNDLATEWNQVGILRPRPRPEDLTELPRLLWVEEERALTFTVNDYTYEQARIADGAADPGIPAEASPERASATPGRRRRTYRRLQR